MVKQYRRSIALVALAALATLFFYGGPNHLSMPTIKYLWNLGHIAFFFCAVSLYLHEVGARSDRQVLMLIISVLAISLTIELIQSQIGRSMSAWDIARNFIGTCTALLLTQRTKIVLSLALVAASLLAADGYGFTKTVQTDLAVAKMAPVLENFESELTFSRWHGKLSQVEAPVVYGLHSARFDLSTESAYPSATLEFPYRDWSGFQTLNMVIFNPDSEPKNLSLRINDEAHELNPSQSYGDRFNKTIELQPGWNEISIPIDSIKSAPKNREMDMKNIVKLVWFMAGLTEPTTIYLDDIWLQ